MIVGKKDLTRNGSNHYYSIATKCSGIKQKQLLEKKSIESLNEIQKEQEKSI